MWDTSIEDFEVIMAARDAQLHEDIMQREGGYQYRITEGGKDFSGGQRQRMEIARVLAQDPTIIILDEATSALDAKTEYDVVNKTAQTKRRRCFCRFLCEYGCRRDGVKSFRFSERQPRDHQKRDR